jgi:Asp-tRNA(Asn)/Glu-tRNA(Gln) amidotransferase C subunit
VAKLQEVDTRNVEAAAQVTGLANVFRSDEITNPTDATDALLVASPLPIVGQQIETPSAHGER